MAQSDYSRDIDALHRLFPYACPSAFPSACSTACSSTFPSACPSACSSAVPYSCPSAFSFAFSFVRSFVRSFARSFARSNASSSGVNSKHFPKTASNWTKMGNNSRTEITWPNPQESSPSWTYGRLRRTSVSISTPPDADLRRKRHELSTQRSQDYRPQAWGGEFSIIIIVRRNRRGKLRENPHHRCCEADSPSRDYSIITCITNIA
jgi:hypothetical protein